MGTGVYSMLRTLERRRDHLQRRLDARTERYDNGDYDEQEHRALEWAITKLKEGLKDAST